MKTNTMMRVASVLLVAVLLSTCAISGTFAKYTSTYTGGATATVAAWAFEMNEEEIANDFTFNLGDTVTEIGGSDEAEVDLSKKVIAPGTEGSFQIKLDNLSDVTAAYDISIELDDRQDGKQNPPVIFTFPSADSEGEIKYGEEKTITVNWKWDWDENTVENQYAGLELTATIEIVLTQVN